MKLKRQNVIDWDTLYIGIAALASFRSKDPDTQNGAVIIDGQKRIVSIGYNGLPDGCSDDEFPWDREADREALTKYPYVLHSEENAFHNSPIRDLDGCALYIFSEKGYLPCAHCSRGIVKRHIKEVVLAWTGTDISKQYTTGPGSFEASQKMFEARGVKIRLLKNPEIGIDKIVGFLNDSKQKMLKSLK